VEIPFIGSLCGSEPFGSPQDAHLPQNGSGFACRTLKTACADSEVLPKSPFRKGRDRGFCLKREMMSKRNSRDRTPRLHSHPQVFHRRTFACSDPAFSLLNRANRGDRAAANRENMRKSSARRVSPLALGVFPAIEYRQEISRDIHSLRQVRPCGKVAVSEAIKGSGLPPDQG
jgi:hypothetical protein